VHPTRISGKSLLDGTWLASVIHDLNNRSRADPAGKIIIELKIFSGSVVLLQNIPGIYSSS